MHPAGHVLLCGLAKMVFGTEWTVHTHHNPHFLTPKSYIVWLFGIFRYSQTREQMAILRALHDHIPYGDIQ